MLWSLKKIHPLFEYLPCLEDGNSDLSSGAAETQGETPKGQRTLGATVITTPVLAPPMAQLR